MRINHREIDWIISGPKIDPCSTPWNWSRYHLKLKLIFILCFFPDRWSNINLSVFISNFSDGVSL